MIESVGRDPLTGEERRLAVWPVFVAGPADGTPLPPVREARYVMSTEVPREMGLERQWRDTLYTPLMFSLSPSRRIEFFVVQDGSSEVERQHMAMEALYTAALAGVIQTGAHDEEGQT